MQYNSIQIYEESFRVHNENFCHIFTLLNPYRKVESDRWLHICANGHSWSDCTGGGSRQYNHIPVLKCGCTGKTIAACAVWSAESYWRRYDVSNLPVILYIELITLWQYPSLFSWDNPFNDWGWFNCNGKCLTKGFFLACFFRHEIIFFLNGSNWLRQRIKTL